MVLLQHTTFMCAIWSEEGQCLSKTVHHCHHQQRWEAISVPYRILEWVGKVTYRVDMHDKSRKQKHVFHVEKMACPICHCLLGGKSIIQEREWGISLLLQPFQFQVCHQPGTDNINADSLSWMSYIPTLFLTFFASLRYNQNFFNTCSILFFE